MATLQSWWVYIVLCNDGTLYTGTTNNLSERLNKHNAGKGAKYTRSRRPVRLLFSEPFSSRSLACKRESEIKKMSRGEKEQLFT